MALTKHLDEVEQSMGLIVEEIIRDKCTPNHCVYGTCHDRYALDSSQSATVATDVTSFVFPKYAHRVKCLCQEGYAGEKKFYYYYYYYYFRINNFFNRSLYL